MNALNIQYIEFFIASLRVFNLEIQRSRSFQRILNLDLGYWDWQQIVPQPFYALSTNEYVHLCAYRGDFAQISAHLYACIQSLNAYLHHG